MKCLSEFMCHNFIENKYLGLQLVVFFIYSYMKLFTFCLVKRMRIMSFCEIMKKRSAWIHSFSSKQRFCSKMASFVLIDIADPQTKFYRTKISWIIKTQGRFTTYARVLCLIGPLWQRRALERCYVNIFPQRPIWHFVEHLSSIRRANWHRENVHSFWSDETC